MKNITVKGNSLNLCPKCNEPLKIREHRIITLKILRQPFYFKKWEHCWKCHYMKSYEADKIYNTVDSILIKENEDNMALFKSI